LCPRRFTLVSPVEAEARAIGFSGTDMASLQLSMTWCLPFLVACLFRASLRTVSCVCTGAVWMHYVLSLSDTFPFGLAHRAQDSTSVPGNCCLYSFVYFMTHQTLQYQHCLGRCGQETGGSRSCAAVPRLPHQSSHVSSPPAEEPLALACRPFYNFMPSLFLETKRLICPLTWDSCTSSPQGPIVKPVHVVKLCHGQMSVM